jgi:hypothetical protein
LKGLRRFEEEYSTRRSILVSLDLNPRRTEDNIEIMRLFLATGKAICQNSLILSHVIQDGIITCQGLPGPKICDHLSREDSKHHYAKGTTFQIGKIKMGKEHIYEQTYQDYLSRVADLDLPFVADKLGINFDGQHATIPFFDKPYRISAKRSDIVDRLIG